MVPLQGVDLADLIAIDPHPPPRRRTEAGHSLCRRAARHSNQPARRLETGFDGRRGRIQHGVAQFLKAGGGGCERFAKGHGQPVAERAIGPLAEEAPALK